MNSKKSEYNDKSNNNVNNATGSNGAQSTAVPSLNNQFSVADVSPEQNAAAPIVEDASQKESPVAPTFQPPQKQHRKTKPDAFSTPFQKFT